MRHVDVEFNKFWMEHWPSMTQCTRSVAYSIFEAGFAAASSAIYHQVEGGQFIHQYGELFIWYDESGLPGGVETSLELATISMKEYFKELG